MDDTKTTATRVPRRADDIGDDVAGLNDSNRCTAELGETRCARMTGHDGDHMGPLSSDGVHGPEFREEWASPGAPSGAKRGRKKKDAAADQGDAPAPPPAPAVEGRFDPAVRLDDIEPSPRRSRHLDERFNETEPDMIDLVESIRAHGVIQPIVLRPRPADARVAARRYELVAGERRWLGSDLAGRKTIPAMICDLSDVQVVKVQLLENLRRKQPHEIDEAEAYRELLDRHGYTVDMIVAETGQSKATIYARLKLLDLAPEVRKLLLARKLQVAIAGLIARIPVHALQVQAAKDVLGLGEPDDREAAGIQLAGVAEDDNDRWNKTREPMSARAAAVYLQRRYMLRLELAKFPINDAQLVPDAGPCATCQHRTGNQAELFGDVAGGDVCTKPPCFELKTKAAFERAAAAAKERGLDVIKPKQAAELFHGAGELRYGADYIDPADKIPYEVWGSNSEPPTWEKALGKQVVAAAPRALAQDPTGAPRELLARDVAVKLLRDAGKVPKPAQAAKADNGEAEGRKKLLRRREIAVRALAQMMVKGNAEYTEGVGKAALPWWQFVAGRVVDLLGNDELRVVAAVLKLEPKGGGPERVANAIRDEIDGPAATVGVLRGLIVMMLAGPDGAGGTWSTGFAKSFTAAAEYWDVDLAKIGKEVDAAAKAAKAAPAKKPAKTRKGR